MHKKIVLSSITLTAILALAIFIAFLVANSFSTSQNQKNHKTLDAFMTNVVYTQLDNNGQISNTLAADRITHYTDKDVYLLQNPHLIITDKENKIWDIKAAKGKSMHNNHIIYLEDNVNIRQIDPSLNQTEITVFTSKATIYPREKIGETDQPIVIKQNNSIVEAIGAKVDFNKATLKLLSDVRGKLETKE